MRVVEVEWSRALGLVCEVAMSRMKQDPQIIKVCLRVGPSFLMQA